jgi:UDP-GlcNAc:undecaprenyl-phosphate GlcNAc-1-phosphate transferase
MTPAALLSHLAFAGSLALLSALVVRLMITVGVMDTPDARKSHSRPTPKGGGVGVVVAFLVGVAVLYEVAAFSRLADPYFRGIIAASVAIAVVAFLDDMYDWPFTVKLGAQVLAALAAVGTGLYVQVYRIPYLGAIDIGWLGIPATLVWILFATNAMNFIDGLNGLAAGVALIASGFLCFIAQGQGGWFVYFAALLLAAGLLGFLPFNYPRARIFMGDVGSQFCGFVLAMLAVAASRFDAVELSFLIVPMLLSGVLFDVAFTLVRRGLAGERVTAAHRSHLYQLAQRSGMSAAAVTATHWGFAMLGGLACLAFVYAPSSLKPEIPLLLIPPQVIWAVWVMRRAHRAELLGSPLERIRS